MEPMTPPTSPTSPHGGQADCWSDASSPAEAHERRKRWWSAQRRLRSEPVMLLRRDQLDGGDAPRVAQALFQGGGGERPRR